MKNLTQDLLKELFHYDPETGHLLWKKARKRGCPDMSRAGCTGTRGYRVVRFSGNVHLEHRLIYCWMTGRYPEQVDHINHIRDDNRWVNIRSATASINGKNQTLRETNKSGVMGVYWASGRGKWRSYIDVPGKRKYLGTFENKSDAINSRLIAEHKYGFHPNHGMVG